MPKIKPLAENDVLQNLNHAGPDWASVHAGGVVFHNTPAQVRLTPAQVTQIVLGRVADLDADECEAILAAVNAQLDTLLGVAEDAGDCGCPDCLRDKEVAA